MFLYFRLQEADLGFHLIVDRRKDRWNSVKAVLLKISGYFPGIVHVVYVLRPSGFFQKAISEVSSVIILLLDSRWLMQFVIIVFTIADHDVI